jgi:nitrogen PTS system EIIA component
MKITDFLYRKTIIPSLKSTDKKGVLEELSLPAAEITGIAHSELVKVLVQREHLGSTGIGGGIGIPHGKHKELNSLILGVGLHRVGLNFDALDEKPTHIFFLLLAPDDSAGLHLKLLARLSRMLKEETFKMRLMAATDVDDVLGCIEAVDEPF